MYSTGIADGPYPSNRKEEVHLIDVTQWNYGYADIRLEIEYFDISGLNGDYVQLGKGTCDSN